MKAASTEKPPGETPPVVVPDPKTKTEAELAKEKADADAAAAKTKHDEDIRKRADELFKDSPALPPNTSPKASESFSAIKIKAAQDIARAEAELEKLRAENAEAKEKLRNAVPPETVKELEDHRAWRAKLDVEADPKFKEFDKSIAQTQEFIYAQLSRSPAVSKEVIEAIKKHGGPENVQMDKIFAAVNDSALQRTIESKLADIEMAKFNKGKAIEAAKANIAEYVATREKQAVESATQHNARTAAHLAEVTKGISWFNEKPIDPKADEATRKSAEAHNAFVKTTREQLAVAQNDDSPEMRAILIAGMAQLFYTQKVREADLAKIAGHDAKVAEMQKALDEVTAKYDKLRSGSVNRSRDTGASPNAPVTAAKKDNFNTPAGDALDNLRKEITEERARAAAVGGK
jgi:hypothetical protein